MFKNLAEVVALKVRTQLYKHTERMVAKAYVRQCERLADGNSMKLKDYLMPPDRPICLFTEIEQENENGHVLLGTFVSVRNEFNEEWVLTFDDYVHANEMAEFYKKETGNTVFPRTCDAITIFTLEEPTMGASCCKTDGIVVETPSSVYKALMAAARVKAKLKAARVNELKKRQEQDNE